MIFGKRERYTRLIFSSVYDKIHSIYERKCADDSNVKDAETGERV